MSTAVESRGQKHCIAMRRLQTALGQEAKVDKIRDQTLQRSSRANTLGATKHTGAEIMHARNKDGGHPTNNDAAPSHPNT